MTGEVFGRDPDSEARRLVARAVHQLAIAAHGDQVIVDRHIEGLSTPIRDIAPLPGLEAARKIRDIADGMIRMDALRARGDGVSWADLAGPLGLAEAADREDVPHAEAAFEYILEHRRPGEPIDRAWSRYPESALWTCSSCGQRVADRGPYEPHPDDRETGHVGDCARHSAEVAEWAEEQR